MSENVASRGMSNSPNTAKEKVKSSQPRLISQLPYQTLHKLAGLLDTAGDGSQVFWRRLIEEMPHIKYDVTTVEKFALNANKRDGSPAYALLTDLANRSVSYEDLIAGLKKLNFYAALSAIGYREAVSFKVQPCAMPVSVGQKVVMECHAIGVPPPSFLWFKGREPLPDHTTCQLVLEKVTVTDAGYYCCRASNDVNIVFSTWAELKVNQPKVLRPGMQVIPGTRTQDVTDSPQIVQATSGEMHVNLNGELRLIVIATAPNMEGLSYQWFREGQSLPYGTEHELFIPHVQLGDQGVYNCRVSSKLGGSKLTENCIVHVIVPHENQALVHQQQQCVPIPHQIQPTGMHQQNGVYFGIHQDAQGIVYSGSTGTQSTTLSELNTPSSQMSTTPSRIQHQFYHGENDRPHNLPISNYMPQHVHDHESRMYCNAEVNQVEKVDQRYPPASGYMQTNIILPVGGEDLLCGQGELRPDLDKPCYDKVALLIGNRLYRQSSLELNTPEYDVQDLAGVLRSAGFKVVSLVNLNKKEMEMAVKYFASLLGQNVYALFFFAGHGFELNHMNYMMAVDADIEKRPEQCLCAQDVLNAMQMRGAKLSIVLLDMCRVNASTPLPPGQLQVLPQPKGSNGYFVIGFSCSPAERAFEAADGSLSDSSYKDNSIFVAALREHLQKGTLNKRIDTLLADSAAGVRKKGLQLQQHDGWQKPEIRSNLGEPLSLNDDIIINRENDSERQARARLWQKAHTVPDPVVVSCSGDETNGVKPGEVAFRLHFEAEHSNVVMVTAELLTGCLTRVEIENVLIVMASDHAPDGTAFELQGVNYNKEYKHSSRSKYGYGHQQMGRANDLVHFKIPDIQKMKSHAVTLVMEVQYMIEIPGEGRMNKMCLIKHTMTPPLYAQVLSQQLLNPPNVPLEYTLRVSNTSMHQPPN